MAGPDRRAAGPCADVRLNDRRSGSDAGSRVDLSLGTGLSSFEYFRKLPVDKVKIDGTFIRGLEEGSRNYAIVQAVVSMARAFSLQTVAEFVENGDIRELLRALGVTYAQGHVVRKPLPIRESFDASR